MIKRTSEWPSTYVPILGFSAPLCNDSKTLSFSEDKMRPSRRVIPHFYILLTEYKKFNLVVALNEDKKSNVTAKKSSISRNDWSKCRDIEITNRRKINLKGSYTKSSFLPHLLALVCMLALFGVIIYSYLVFFFTGGSYQNLAKPNALDMYFIMKFMYVEQSLSYRKK